MSRWLSRRRGQDETSLYVSCVDRPVCMVFFEPWGSEYELRAEDRLELRANDVEGISAAKDGIAIWFRVDDPQIVNRVGQRIKT